jgi:putative aldouronate transport system permease protein
MSLIQTGAKLHRRSSATSRFLRDKWLYLLMLPGILYFAVFKYLPMWGIVIAFQNYVPFSGVLKSEWVGLKWFEYFFSNPAFSRLMENTLWLSFLNIVFFFPAPIILALLLNELRSQRYKKVVQTFLYVPHFISIVIVVSISYVAFGSGGIIYRLAEQILGEPVKFLTAPSAFRPMIIGQTIWKETGWGTIIFLAALTGVDTQLYEAAMCDGAGRLRQLWHITLPAIRSTIVLLLVLRMGSVLDTGYEHLILMANSLNRNVSQTFDVFVYQQGIQSGQYSYATAVGLFKAVISVILVAGSNKIAHRFGEPGLY